MSRTAYNVMHQEPTSCQALVPEFLRHVREQEQQIIISSIRQVSNGSTQGMLRRLRLIAIAKRARADYGSLQWKAADELWRLTSACPNRLVQFAESLTEQEGKA